MNTSKLWAGASGYAFKEWKGSFYPEKIQPEAMLGWYAERLPAVEINNTFYQMPKVAVLAHWVERRPRPFASRSRRRAASPTMPASRPTPRPTPPPTSTGISPPSAPSAGRCSFSCRPFSRRTCPAWRVPAVAARGHQAVFEFRNDSWFDDDVYAALQAAGAALCLSEREDNAPPPLVETAPWGYLRLRLEHYSEETSRTGLAGSRRHVGRRRTCTSCTSRRRPAMRRACCA
jgi:uncharacterized protein YecE (DUF72 family)